MHNSFRVVLTFFTMNIYSLLLIPGVLALLLACDPTIDSPDPGLGEGFLGIDIPTGFDFTTTKSVEVNLSANPNILPDEFYESEESSNARITSIQEDILTLGTLAGNGKPSYLLEPDKISNQLLKIINTSLPERKDVRNGNPQVLDEKYERELSIKIRGERCT